MKCLFRIFLFLKHIGLVFLLLSLVLYTHTHTLGTSSLSSICKYFLQVCGFFYILNSIFCSTRDLNFDSPIYHCFFLLWFVLLVLYLKTLCQTPGPGVSFCYSLRADAKAAFEEAEGNCDGKMISGRGCHDL